MNFDVSKVSEKLVEILKLIPDKNLTFTDNNAELKISDNRTLLQITPSNITVPGTKLLENIFKKLSPLKDSFVLLSQIKELFINLVSHNLFARLNHIGFCYEAESTAVVDPGKQLHMYKEESNDKTRWLFIGDTANWQDPLIELIPVENTKDRWKDYWLPHIQIDIDTYLNGQEIEEMITHIFKGKVMPYRLIEINNLIVLVRARLGIVSGVNINLDIGAESRMIRNHRNKLLKKII